MFGVEKASFLDCVFTVEEVSALKSVNASNQKTAFLSWFQEFAKSNKVYILKWSGELTQETPDWFTKTGKDSLAAILVELQRAFPANPNYANYSWDIYTAENFFGLLVFSNGEVDFCFNSATFFDELIVSLKELPDGDEYWIDTDSAHETGRF